MRGHIRQQGRGSWELKYDIGPDPITGRRRVRYKTVRGKKKDADKELAAILHQLDDSNFTEPSKITTSDFLEQWLTDHARHRVSAKTFERYAEIVRGHLKPAIGTHALAKLTPMHIEGCYSRALSTRRTRKLKDGTPYELAPLSAQTVKHHHRVLSQALKHAVRQRIIAHNPAEDVDAPRPVGCEMKILDPRQAAGLIEAAEGTSLAIVVLLALTTGMRRGEILAVRWQDVQLEARSLSVRQTLEETRDGLHFKAPKTERSRRAIALPALTVEALRRHRTRQAEQMLALGIRQSGDMLVCCDAAGDPLRPRNVTKGFARLTHRLKVPVRFHDLRHTHISHLLAAGVHPKVASERAGHASTAITMDRYSHVLPGLQEDAANRIDAVLRTPLER